MGELRDFVSDVLEIEGSAVEAVEPDGLEVLAPEPLRTAMGWPELVRLGFGAALPAGALAVGRSKQSTPSPAMQIRKIILIDTLIAACYTQIVICL